MQGGGVLGREGPGALLWGPLKVTLWPVSHSSPSPSPPLGGLEPRPWCHSRKNSQWHQRPQPISFLLPLPKGALAEGKCKRGVENGLLSGFEKKVGWASLEFQKTTCSCSTSHFTQTKCVCKAGRSAFQKVQGGLVPHCLCHSKFQTIFTKSVTWGNDTSKPFFAPPHKN